MTATTTRRSALQTILGLAGSAGLLGRVCGPGNFMKNGRLAGIFEADILETDFTPGLALWLKAAFI